MKEEKAPVKSSAGKDNEPGLENGKKKTKEEKPPTKVVVRRLPPSMSEEQFKMQISPLPDFDYFYFVPADKTLMPNAFCRAYINFVDQSDLFIFTQKFDGYVFVDSKGAEYPAVVEFAPFQRIPKNRPNRKKDPKCGTIETDPYFIAFKERLEAESLENKNSTNASKQHFFETSLVAEKKESGSTPLLEFIKNRRAERQRMRDEKREEKRKKDLERRKAKEEQRRTKKDDDASVVKVLHSQYTSKERAKEKEMKQGVKKKTDETKMLVKERQTSEPRSKESRTRVGKSYQEERQRQAERREEQRKKMSQSQTSSSVETKLSSVSEEDHATPEGKSSEEKSVVPEHKGKEFDYKKPERGYKKEESKKNSYKYEKYESKRDRESDDRRNRRLNSERSYQSSRRDDERTEESGRKRYSETKRNSDSVQRERYKDRDKVKTYSSKKSSNSSSEFDKSKTANKTSDKPNPKTSSDEPVETNLEKNKSEVKDDEQPEEKNIDDVKLVSDVEPRSFESKDRVKPTRRKSLDNDKGQYSSTYNSSKSYNKEKYSERMRRNSVGSSKYNQDDNNEITINKTENLLTEELNSSDGKPNKGETPTELQSEVYHDGSENEYKEKDNKPKRRNSTGESQGSEKSSPRRNSLGSKDQNEINVVFKNHKFDGDDKSRDDKLSQNGNQDPRTERRIRNKDRPTQALYRPGMGKLCKQRLEREKGLGSSTEVESPSSSPSPTPTFKHKTVPPH